MCVCARACVRACLPACLRACVQALVVEREGLGGSSLSKGKSVHPSDWCTVDPLPTVGWLDHGHCVGGGWSRPAALGSAPLTRVSAGQGGGHTNTAAPSVMDVRHVLNYRFARTACERVHLMRSSVSCEDTIGHADLGFTTARWWRVCVCVFVVGGWGGG